ncbi:MAG: hypothetical protein ACRC8S_01920 [Fimbriiglobus sp.]
MFRFLDFCITPFAVVFGWLRRCALWLQILLVLAIFGLSSGAMGYGYHRWNTGRKQAKMMDAWKEFEEGVKAGNRQKMLDSIDRVLDLYPEDELARSRKKAIETGEADPKDEPMVRLTMIQLFRENKHTEAAREADKWLTFHPQDWLANCIKCLDALERGDRVNARKILDTLPDPNADKAHIDGGGLILAFRLFQMLEKDPKMLREFVQGRVSPLLKTPTFINMPTDARLNMITCYLEGFEAGPGLQPQPLVEGWSPAMRLLELSTDDALETKDKNNLIRAGRTTNLLIIAAGILGRTGQLNPEQTEDFSKDLRTKAEKIWAGLKAADPKAPEAYRGLATCKAEQKDLVGAFDEVIKGLEQNPKDGELSQMFSRLLQHVGRADIAWNQMYAKAKAEPENKVWWGLATDAAVANHRRDLALLACREMQQHHKNDPWAIRMEAKLWIDAGDPNQAAQLLHKFGLDTIAKDLELCRVYARALAASGLSTQLPELIQKSEELAEKHNIPLGLAGVLLGWTDAKPSYADSLKIAELSQQYSVRWKDFSPILLARAEALYRAAELATPPFDSTAATAAVQAASRYQGIMPKDRRMAVMLVNCHVYGTKNYQQAYRDAVPIRDVESDPTLTIPELEALGLVYLKNNKPQDAVRILRRACASPLSPASTFVHLGWAHLELKQPDEAWQALRQAQSRPRTPQEQAEYVSLAQTLQKEKQ